MSFIVITNILFSKSNLDYL